MALNLILIPREINNNQTDADGTIFGMNIQRNKQKRASKNARQYYLNIPAKNHRSIFYHGQQHFGSACQLVPHNVVAEKQTISVKLFTPALDGLSCVARTFVSFHLPSYVKQNLTYWTNITDE